MKNIKLLLKKHGFESNEAMYAAEIMANAIMDDVLYILNTYSTKPIHERIAQYFRFEKKQ